jgi:hypothetical protein
MVDADSAHMSCKSSDKLQLGSPETADSARVLIPCEFNEVQRDTAEAVNPLGTALLVEVIACVCVSSTGNWNSTGNRVELGSKSITSSSMSAKPDKVDGSRLSVQTLGTELDVATGGTRRACDFSTGEAPD